MTTRIKPAREPSRLYRIRRIRTTPCFSSLQKSTSTSADPFAHLNIVKADMEQPLVMSFRVKQVKDEGNIRLLFRGSGFMNVFNLEQSKVTFFPKFVELGTDKTSNPSSIVLERVNDRGLEKGHHYGRL